MGRTKNQPKKINSGNTSLVTNSKITSRKTVNYNVIYNNFDIKNEYYVGEIWIGKTDNLLPPEWKKCKVEFVINSNEKEDFLKLEFDTNNIYVVVNVNTDIKYLKGLISKKIFFIKLVQRNDLVFADLYFPQFPLSFFTPNIGEIIKTTFAIIYDKEFEKIDISKDQTSSSNIEIDHVYRDLKKYNTAIETSELTVQHPCLIPKLRLYQEDAVKWMINREKIDEIKEEILNPMFEKVQLKGGKIVYLNKYTGFIECIPPLVPKLRTGGILADEMGLGKTLEVLACILCNPQDTIETNEDSEGPCNQPLEKTLFDKQSKKRKKPSANKESSDDKLLYVDKPKKLKVPENWVKNSKQKSTTYLALQTWYQNILGEMSVKKPEVVKTRRVQCICGDLDESKTVECVDCLKLQHIGCFNFKGYLGPYRCPQCWELQPYIESKGTMIVCPKALLNQWLTEISKHIKNGLKVLNYEGFPIYPTKLKEYDIVLTTYTVLQSELRLTEIGESAVLRRTPRYCPPGCPIARMKWWRICLDEAQTVEIPTTMVSEMAAKLNAVHRWAVTGTPISKDISDLYGLINYLQFQPYDDIECWNYLLYYPYLMGRKQPIYEFLGKILWRNSKSDILNQIDIPPQTVNIQPLEFSAVERYFYRREHELSANDFLDKLKNYELDIPIGKLSKTSLKSLMAPLLSIRQACSHPNAVKGRYLASRKQVSSMKSLLEALIDKNVNESEEHLRVAVSAINGIAGIYILLNSPEQAVEEYRKVLQLSAKFGKENQTGVRLTIDKLQLIHTMHNLADILDRQPSVAPTLRDSTLRKDCSDLEKQFIEKHANETLAAYKESSSATREVLHLEEKQTLVEGQWYEELLKWVTIENYSKDLFKRIETALDNAELNKLSEFSNEKKMLYRLTNWSQSVMNLRDETMSLLEQMYTISSDNNNLCVAEGLVEIAADCHLRPQKKMKKEKRQKCLVCVVNNKMREYETKLFNTTKVDDPAKSNKGDWKPTVYELVLKALVNLGKAKKGENIYVENGLYFCKQIEKMKKEFKELRKFWTFLDKQICAQDEVDMCKIRLSLKDPNSEKPTQRSKVDRIIKQLSATAENKFETIHMLDLHELNYQIVILKSEANQQLKSLEKTLGTHGYLETLRNDQEDDQKTDCCPICKTQFTKHRSVLPCGHCYCLDCIEILLEQSFKKKLSCSICRELHKIEDISYIRIGKEVKDSETVKIQGSYSTKVEAVIRLMLRLKSEDDTVKILIFSTWTPILKIIKDALIKNEITCELYQNVQTALTKFKDPEQDITVLLLPIHLGSRGLNLIEATHVVLVEPLLNPDDELQAVGRVHRIGQTRPTFVHKFYITKTIEENIYSSTSCYSEKWDKNRVTLKELHDLFIVTDEKQEITESEENNLTSQNVESINPSGHIPDDSSNTETQSSSMLRHNSRAEGCDSVMDLDD